MEKIQSLASLSAKLRQFVDERDWGQFHNPKNLAMALAAEAGELLEHFQWLTAEEAEKLPAETMDAVALEMADILMFLVRLSDRLGVDLLASAGRKLEINRRRYPAAKAKGRATKYDKL